MILAIVGSREFKIPHAFLTARYYIEYHLRDIEPSLIISGGARGIDSIAIEIAERLGYPWEEYLPENPQWEPRGYKDRNTRIAEECGILLSIRCHASTSNGSGWTAAYAAGLGKEVIQHIF